MSSEAKFQCPSCQRSFKWKPELAGRSARCKCGQTVKVPEQMPGAAERDWPEPISQDAYAQPEDSVGSDLDRLASAASGEAPRRAPQSASQPEYADPAYEVDHGDDWGNTTDFRGPAGRGGGRFAGVNMKGVSARIRSGRGASMMRSQDAINRLACLMASISLGILVLAMIVGQVAQGSTRGSIGLAVTLEVLSIACFAVAIGSPRGRVIFIVATALRVIALILLIVMMNGGGSATLFTVMVALGQTASIIYFVGLLVVGVGINHVAIIVCASIAALLETTFTLLILAVRRVSPTTVQVLLYSLIGLVIALLVLFIVKTVSLRKQALYAEGHAREPQWG